MTQRWTGDESFDTPTPTADINPSRMWPYVIGALCCIAFVLVLAAVSLTGAK